MTAPGLRERKKLATRQALHEAALALAAEHGVDRITVEAIADDAGVSRRTFSNYFASKEQALLHGDQQRMLLLVEAMRARPADESAWAALTNAAADFYRELGELDPAGVTRSRLVRGHPALAAQQVQIFTALERELSAEVALRLGDEGVRARLAAATYMATLRVALNAWLDMPPGTRLWDVVRNALAESGRGFA